MPIRIAGTRTRDERVGQLFHLAFHAIYSSRAFCNLLIDLVSVVKINVIEVQQDQPSQSHSSGMVTGRAIEPMLCQPVAG